MIDARTLLRRLAVWLAAAFVLTAATTSVVMAKARHSSPKWKIALSNSFMGNDWRQEMQNVALVVSKEPPFNKLVSFKIFDTENTVQAQSASIRALVQQGYNAILVDAASPTGLNSAIQYACVHHVVIVSFDQVVTAPCAYKRDSNWNFAAHVMALYLAKVLHGHGNIIFDRGLPGATVSYILTNDALAVFHKYPGIKIVGYFDGQYAEGPTEQGVASLLAANPNVNAVYTQGYCTSVVRAFAQAGKKPVPMACQGYNGNFLVLAKPGANGIITVNTPGLSAIALQVAVDVLEGKHVPKVVHLQPPVFVTDTHINLGVPVQKIRLGVNAFPNLPPGLTWPAAPPQFHVTPQEALGR